MSSRLRTLGLAAAIAVALPSYAQDKGSSTPPASGARSADKAAPGADSKSAARLSRDDRNFVEKAASAGMAEVETGKMAVSRAENPEIKKFGQQMVDDHSKANEELRTIATQKNIKLPTSLDRSHAGLVKKLDKLTGAEFDREYIREAGTKAHQDTRRLFEKAQKDSKDPEIRAFAEKNLPVIVKHHEMAQNLAGAAKNRPASK